MTAHEQIFLFALFAGSLAGLLAVGCIIADLVERHRRKIQNIRSTWWKE